MSETHANTVDSPQSRRTPLVAIATTVCLTLAVLCGAGGFWLGRSGPSRASAPVTQPSAVDIAEQQEAAEKANYPRVGKLISVLDKEKNLIDLELNEGVLKQLAEK